MSMDAEMSELGHKPSEARHGAVVGSLQDLVDVMGQDEVDRIVCEAIGTNAAKYPLSPADIRGEDGIASIELDAFLDYRDRDALEETVHDWLRDGTAEGILASVGWDVDRALVELAFQLNEMNVETEHDIVGRGLDEAASALERLVDGRTIDGVTIAAEFDRELLVDELTEEYNPYVELMGADEIASVKSKATILVADVPHDRHLECNASGNAVAWAAERFYDPATPYDDAEYERPDGGSNLEWLCETQGTSLGEVVAGGAGSGAFATSLAEEVSECVPATPGYQCLAALVTMDVRQYLTVLAGSDGRDDAASVTLPSGKDQPVMGIFDPVYGAGSMLGIELDRDVRLPLGSVEAVLCEEGRGCATCSGATLYTASDTFGLVPESWFSRMRVDVAAPAMDLPLPVALAPEREAETPATAHPSQTPRDHRLGEDNGGPRR